MMFSKIKNANDMLGFLIANANTKNEIPGIVAMEKSGIDTPSATSLIKELSVLGYVIQTTDIIYVTSLGEANYRSPIKRVFIWLIKSFLFTIKTLIAYIAGAVTVIGSELVILYVTSPKSVEEFLSSVLDLL